MQGPPWSSICLQPIPPYFPAHSGSFLLFFKTSKERDSSFTFVPWKILPVVSPLCFPPIRSCPQGRERRRGFPSLHSDRKVSLRSPGPGLSVCLPVSFSLLVHYVGWFVPGWVIHSCLSIHLRKLGLFLLRGRRAVSRLH